MIVVLVFGFTVCVGVLGLGFFLWPRGYCRCPEKMVKAGGSGYGSKKPPAEKKTPTKKAGAKKPPVKKAPAKKNRTRKGEGSSDSLVPV